MKTDAEIDVFLNSLDNLSTDDIKKFVEELRETYTAPDTKTKDVDYLEIAKKELIVAMLNVTDTLASDRAEIIAKCAETLAHIEDIQRSWGVYSVD